MSGTGGSDPRTNGIGKAPAGNRGQTRKGIGMTKDTTESRVSQIELLIAIADGIHHGELLAHNQVERIARIAAKALAGLDERLTQLELESCNRVSTARLEAATPCLGSYRPDLRASLDLYTLSLPDLLRGCRLCSAAFEIMEIGGCSSPISHHARCGDPMCSGNSVYNRVSAETAQAYEDRLTAEDQSFGVQHEEGR